VNASLQPKAIVLTFSFVLAVSAFAATPSNEKPVGKAVSVSEINRDSVKVWTPTGSSAANLSFLFRDKSAGEVRKLYFVKGPQAPPVVRITDGSVTIVETQVAGLRRDDTKGKERGGLILSFDSLEEANRVALALRPALK
jgi:hypothetical protein